MLHNDDSDKQYGSVLVRGVAIGCVGIEYYGSESTKLSSIVVKLFLNHNKRSLDITSINQPC